MARIPIALVTLSLALGLARAQDAGVPVLDPPDRAARLSFIEGNVSLQPDSENAWAPAILNRPLTGGDKLSTDQGARAEIQVGPAAVRLDENTGFSFLNVDDNSIQMHMTEGVVSVSIRALNESDRIEIDTPNLTLSLLHPGSYRIEVYPGDDTTIVKVRDGEAQANGPSQNVIVRAAQAVTFTGSERLTSQFDSLGQPDEFDSWTQDRERRDYLATSRSGQYVAPEVTGYQDLDNYGTWSTESEYGNVWTPSYVGANWSPYSYGRWLWVSPWGWTWIDDQPWGYAPFHYGRWAYARNRWCWVPGPRHVRAVYAPALVGWVGSGRGNVSWFPLGPRDVYMPDGRYSRRYVERVNVTNAVIVRSVVNEVYDNRARNVSYRNRVVPGAVTTVTRATFAASEGVGNRRVRIDDRDIARTQATEFSPHVYPARESRLGGPAREPAPRPSQANVTRQVIATRKPPQSNVPATQPAHPSRPVVPDRPVSADYAQRVPSPQRAPSPQRPVQSEQTRGDAQEIARRVREFQDRQPEVQQRQQREAQQYQQYQPREQRQQQETRPQQERVQRSQNTERANTVRQVQQQERAPERARPQQSNNQQPQKPPADKPSKQQDSYRPQRN